MKILSINVSEPKKIVFNGKELITSIYKKPINGSVDVSDIGISGDRQADMKVHGGYDKAVYAYSYKHYKKWSDEMGQEYSEYGLVGENLTIDDFDEKSVKIGDEFEVGSCILQVSQPRIPCFKIGIKMNSREFPKKFSTSGLLGSYLRVIQNGSIQSGDELKLIKTEEDSLSLFDIASILFKDINNIEKVDEIDAGVVIDIPIRRKPSGLGTNPTSTEFMDAATKEMLEDMTPVKAGFWDFLFGKKEPQKFEITVDEIKEYAKENFDPVQAAAFVATFEAETGSGKDLVENGYGKKDAVRVFVEANRRKDGTLSAAMKERKKKIEKAKDSEEIFNIVYGNRLGNTSSGDGFTYRGRGPIMLTGKENYKKVGDAIGVDLVKNPDLLITDKNVALKATMAYLQQKKFNSVSSASELAAVVGHSNPKGKEGIRRWNKASKIYEEMYGTIMPTKKPKQRPEGFKGIVINEDTNPSTSLRPKARPLGRP